MIILESFKHKGQIVEAPKISASDIALLEDSDYSKLSEFLSQKVKWAEEAMTEDERAIGSKLFSDVKLNQFRSEREGLNHTTTSVFMLFASMMLLASAPLFLIFNLLWTGIGIVLCLKLLRKADNTRWDGVYLKTSLALMSLATVTALIVTVVAYS